jgi:probable rRNA maturation factor
LSKKLRRGRKPPAKAARARRNADGSVQIEVVARSTRWRRQPRAATTVKSAILAAAKAVTTTRAELAIVLSHDSAIQALNRDWRGKNAPTNVLSFPAAPAGPVRRGGKPREPSPYIGDIVIAYETTAREAAAEGKPFNHHLAHLAVHGFLHLVGYEHENDRDAEEMERLERRILRRMAIPDPYARHDIND